MELVLVILFQYIKETPCSETGVSIAKVLIQNLEKIRDMSLETAAEFCMCSPSTFSRFLKSIGIPNFKELRKMLSFPKAVYHSEGFNKDVFMENINYNLQEVNKIPGNIIKKVVLDIYNAKRIIFLAFPTNYSHLLDFQCKMMMNRKYVEIFSKSQIQDEIQTLSKDDLVIMISYQGNFFIENQIMETLFERKVKKILITQTYDKKYNDLDIVIKCGAFSYYGESSYALMYLLDIIYNEYTQYLRKGKIY